MATRGRIKGYGSGEEGFAAQYVVAINFNHPLSSKVRLECYDNNQTFPAVDSATATSNDVFGLTSGYATTMIAMRDTTNGTAGAGTSWFPTAYAASNTATINLMAGLAHYITQQGATLSTAGGGTVYFNVWCNIPASTQTDDLMGFDISARYSFISTTPTVSWWFNNGENSGTEASPVWASIISGSWGIVHCKSGTSAAGPFLANIPETGAEKTVEGWVVDSI